MEYWNAGILGIKVEINYFNCKKLLQTHHSITPLFHYSNWGEAPKSKIPYLPMSLTGKFLLIMPLDGKYTFSDPKSLILPHFNIFLFYSANMYIVNTANAFGSTFSVFGSDQANMFKCWLLIDISCLFLSLETSFWPQNHSSKLMFISGLGSGPF